jgi:hypothetical protein
MGDFRLRNVNTVGFYYLFNCYMFRSHDHLQVDFMFTSLSINPPSPDLESVQVNVIKNFAYGLRGLMSNRSNTGAEGSYTTRSTDYWCQCFLCSSHSAKAESIRWAYQYQGILTGTWNTECFKKSFTMVFQTFTLEGLQIFTWRPWAPHSSAFARELWLPK